MGAKCLLYSNVLVHSLDAVTQAILHNKLKANANGLYWGKPREAHLKKRCTGTPKSIVMPYQVPPH